MSILFRFTGSLILFVCADVGSIAPKDLRGPIHLRIF